MGYQLAYELTIAKLRGSGWRHAGIGTMTYAVFNKLDFVPITQDIVSELAELTDWPLVSANIVILPNGDVVSTVILEVKITE